MKTSENAIDVLLAVASLGGRLGIIDNKLRAQLPADCPLELKNSLRSRKDTLLRLLRMNFLVVKSDVLNCTIFWTPDESTKESLAAAGADWSSIYTEAELRELVDRRITENELPTIHLARKAVRGRIVQP